MPGAHGLRERRGIHHALGVQREHRRQRFAAEAQLHVRVVLEHDEVVLACQLQQRLALDQREGVAGGVLEVGDDVGELRPHGRCTLSGEQPREGVGVDAVGCQLHRMHTRPPRAQREQGTVVGGALHDHVVPLAHQLLEQKRVGLHRAVGHEHPLGLHAVALGDPRAQTGVADRGAIGGGPGGVARKRSPGRIAQPLDIDDVERRGSPRE